MESHLCRTHVVSISTITVSKIFPHQLPLTLVSDVSVDLADKQELIVGKWP